MESSILEHDKSDDYRRVLVSTDRININKNSMLQGILTIISAI